MTLEQLLEEDKEELLAQLKKAGTPERAVPLLEKEVDRLLLKYNETCESQGCREEARRLLGMAQIGCGFTDTVAEIRYWERSLPETGENKTSGRPAVWTAILLTACVLCTGLGGFLLFSAEGVSSLSVFPVSVILLSAGFVCALVGGLLLGTKKKPELLREHLTENRVDEEKLFRLLKAACLAADESLQEILAREDWEKRSAGTEELDQAGIPETELLLLSDLLEAKRSGDGAYALEKLSEVDYYLHQKKIEVAEYGPETERMFDRIPAKSFGVIRPALIREGQVLRRGLLKGPEDER